MNPSARSALTLAVLLVLPQLQALCPRLAPDVISGKVIPCRYLCIKINFLELPSIVLSTERDGVLCSTLLLRRRGVCKNGGCIPFGSDDDIKPKGALGKVIAAIDKFASGSYRQKAPKPGTPFGPIVSTASSIFGGGSSKTSGSSSTSSAASSIVATATVAAVGSTFKKLLSQGASALSEKKPHSEHPFSSIFQSISKPDHHPASAPAGTLSSSSGATPVSFGGGPPVFPPSTEGGTDSGGTPAAPVTPSMSSGHPALPPLISPAEHKPKESLSPGSATGTSGSNGNVMTHALGLVLGNLHKISGPTSGTSSPSVVPNGPIGEAGGGSGTSPTSFPFGQAPPIAIAPSSPSLGRKRDGEGINPGIPESANLIEAGHRLTASGQPAVSNFGYTAKISTIASSSSRPPFIESSPPSAASQAGTSFGSQLNGPYGPAFARLKEISQGSSGNTFTGQPSSADFSGATVPSRNSRVVTLPEGASGADVNHNKGTVTNVPSAGATQITVDYGHGRPSVFPLAAKREEAPRWPGPPNTESRPLNNPTQAVGVPTGTLLGTSQILPSNPLAMKPPLIGSAHFRPPPKYTSGSSSGSLIKTSLTEALTPFKQKPAGTASAIPFMQPLSPNPGEASTPTNKPSINTSHKIVITPEVNPRKETAAKPFHGKLTPPITKPGGSVPPSAAAETKVAQGSQSSAAPGIIQGPAVISSDTVQANIAHIRGHSEIFPNKPSDRRSLSVGSSDLGSSAASGSKKTSSSQVENTFGRRLNTIAGQGLSSATKPTGAVSSRNANTFEGALNTLKRASNNVTPTSPLGQPFTLPALETPKPSGSLSIQNIQKESSTLEVKNKKNTVSGALPGTPKRRNEQLGGGAPTLPAPIIAATDSSLRTLLNSTARNRALRPTNRAAAGTEGRVTNEENVSQVSSNKPITGLLYSTKNSALGFPSVSRPASSGEKRMETSGVSLTSLLQISKGSSLPTPTKKILIPLKERLKQIRLHKAVTVSQRGQTQIEKTVTLRGSASRKPAEIGSNAPIKSESGNIDKQPAAPALRLISSTAGMAESSTRGSGALPQLSSSILVNAPLPSKAAAPVGPPALRNQGTRESQQLNPSSTSITSFLNQRSSEAEGGRSTQTIDSLTKGSHSAAKPGTTKSIINGSSAHRQLPSSIIANRAPLSVATAQVAPATSRTPGLLESRQRALPTPGITPSEAGSGTTKPAINSLAHGSRSAARTGTTETSSNIIKSPSLLSHAALHNRAPLLAEAELAEKSSISKTLSPLKNKLPGELHGTRNALPPGLPRKIAHSSHIESLALPLKSGGTSKLPSLPATKKSSTGSGSGDSRVRPKKRFFGGFFSRFKHKRKQNHRKSPSTRNDVVKGGVSSPSKDMGSAKPKMVTSLNSGVKGSLLPGQPAAVPPIMPNPLLIPSQRKEHSSLLKRTESRTKSFGVKPTIPENGTTNALGKTEDALSSKSKNAPSTHNKKASSQNNAASARSSPHGGVKTSAIDGRNSLYTKGGQIHLSNHVPPVSELGAPSSKIANVRTTTNITSTDSALYTTTVQGNKQGLALDQHTKKKASPIVPSGTVTSYRNINNKKRYESANKPYSTTLSTRTSRTAEATQNSVQPISRIPSTLGVGSSGTIKGTKTASRSISSISHGNTAATPSTPITTTGAPSRAYSGNQLAPRQIAVQQNPTPAIAAASSGSNQGSQTSLPGTIEATKNAVSPSIEVPSAHGSVTSTAVTASKNASPSIPSTLRRNTVTAPLQPTAPSGPPSSAHASRQLAPKPMQGPQSPASSVAAASYSSSQGSQTSGPIENMVNSQGSGGTFHIKSGTSSQQPSSTTQRVDSKMSPSRDNLSKAGYVSTTRSMDGTSRPFEKPSVTAASLPVSTSTLVTPTLSVQSSPSIATVNAASGVGGTLAATVATKKHTPTDGSLPSTKGSVSLGTTAHPAPTPAVVSTTSGVSLAPPVRNFIPANPTVGTFGSTETSKKQIPTASSTSASATSGVSLVSLVRNVIAANQLAGSLGTKQTSEKHTLTASSLSGVKGSASFGRAEQGVETPKPSPAKPANTIASAHRSATTAGPQIGLVNKSSAGLATPNMETPGIIPGSTANFPATPVASTTYSRNSLPKASENEVTKAGKRTTPVSHLSASAPKISVPKNVKASRSLAMTTEKKSFVNVLKSVPRLRSSPLVPKENAKSVQKSAPRLRSSALDLEVNASNNVKNPEELAGSLQKAGTNSMVTTAPASSLPSVSTVLRSPIKPENSKRPVKPSRGISSLGSIFSNQANALRSTVQSAGSAVPKLLSKIATNKGESRATEARVPMVANSATQPAAPSLPTFTAPMDRQPGQITNGEQPSSTLYPGMRQSDGMVYGNPHMQNGFWGPPQGMAGMFRPF